VGIGRGQKTLGEMVETGQYITTERIWKASCIPEAGEVIQGKERV
jgi:hypothetical protein